MLPPTLCNKNHNNKERTWMNLQGIASHEKSQSLKRICRLMPVIHQSRHDPIVQPGEWVAVGQVFSRRSRGWGGNRCCRNEAARPMLVPMFPILMGTNTVSFLVTFGGFSRCCRWQKLPTYMVCVWDASATCSMSSPAKFIL